MPALQAPWYRAFDRLLPAALLVFFQARLWLWLWPMPEHAVAYRTATPEFILFYYAMASALVAAVSYNFRWFYPLIMAMCGLLICWGVRIFLR